MNVLVLIVITAFLTNGKIGEKIVRRYYAIYMSNIYRIPIMAFLFIHKTSLVSNNYNIILILR